MHKTKLNKVVSVSLNGILVRPECWQDWCVFHQIIHSTQLNSISLYYSNCQTAVTVTI